MQIYFIIEKLSHAFFKSKLFYPTLPILTKQTIDFDF